MQHSSSPVAGQGSKAMHLNHCISSSVGPVLQTRWRLDMLCLAHWVPVSASDKTGCCVALLKARHVLLTQEAGRSEVGLSRLGAQATHAFDHILLASFVTHCYKVMQQPASDLHWWPASRCQTRSKPHKGCWGAKPLHGFTAYTFTSVLKAFAVWPSTLEEFLKACIFALLVLG